MIHKSFLIEKYIPTCFDKSCFKASYTSNTQIIIGTNGSGKSSITLAHAPLPMKKTIFKKHGKVHRIIEHEGSTYEISSDFSKPHSHSFIKDGEELNMSGTTTVQNDLAETHLGYTASIHKLTYGRVDFCKSTRSERKNVLMQAIAADMSFIEKKYKALIKIIRACKNNSSMLTKRMSEIKEKMLDDDVYEQRRRELDKALKHKQRLDQDLLLVNNHLNLLREKLTSVDGGVSKKELAAYVNDLQINIESTRLGADYVDDNDKYMRVKLDIESSLNKFSVEDDMHRYQCDKLKRELDSHTQKRKQLTEFGGVDFERELDELDKSLTLLKDVDVAFIISTDAMERAPRHLSSINQLCCDIFDAKIDKFLTLDQCKRIQRKLTDLEGRLLQAKLSSSNIAKQLAEYRDELNTVDIIPTECVVSTCQLRNASAVRADRIKKLVKQLLDDVAFYERQIKQYGKAFTKLNDLYNASFPYAETVDRLVRHLNIEMWTAAYASSHKDLYNQIHLNVGRIHSDCCEIYENNKLFRQKEELSIKRSKLLEKVKQLAIDDNLSPKALDKLISVTEKEIERHLKAIKDMEKDVSAKKKMSESLSIAKRLYSQGNDVMQMLQKQLTRMYIVASIKYYEHMRETIVGISDKVMSDELIEIKRVIKEQETLRIRLKDEIEPLLKKSDDNLSEHLIYDEALGNKGIANMYLAQILGTVIKNANYFISKVWTYRMEILPIPDDKPVDFNFPIYINDNVCPDISECSSGQQQMINLALTLALLLQMGALDKYPLILDEPDRQCDPEHRERLLNFCSELTSTGLVRQMFIINHYAPFASGFKDSEVICLSQDNVVLPPVYNENVELY